MKKENNESEEIEKKDIENPSNDEKENETIEEITYCKKCGSILTKNNNFCTICGTDQTKKEPEKLEAKEKIETKNIGVEHIVVACIITALITLALSFLMMNYLNDNSVNIDSSNKNVTINDSGIAESVEKVYDSVVVVENYINKKLYASGSGFVFKTDDKYGYILTNNHVINQASEVYMTFTDNSKVKAEVVGADSYSDIAVLRVDKKYVKQVAITGDNSKMKVGDTTFAIGTPLDSSVYSWSVTRGILSGKDRLVSDSNGYMTVLQTDTPINSGNSGGPLCNANGEVIGITNMKLASAQIEGMGFAIPIETALEYANTFINGDDIRRPYIGVSIYDASTYFSNEIQVVIESVEKSSPAEKAGIQKGDIIVKVNDEEIENASHFKYELYKYDIGDEIKITVSRNGKEKTLKVKLSSNSKAA